MKKLLTLLLLFPLLGFSQFDINGSRISTVVTEEGVSAQDLHSRLNFAIANIFNSANDVIQLNDTEANRLVVKGLAKINVPNGSKIMFPKNKMVPSAYEYDHDITLNIASREGRYRIELTYSDGKIWIPQSQYVTAQWKELEYPAKMDFNQTDIDYWVSYWETQIEEDINWKLIGKKKKALYLSNIPSQIKGYQNSLIEYSKTLFESIQESVSSGETVSDDW